MVGSLICLEGFEGAGKTTRAQALQRTLVEAHSRSCLIVREPGGDGFAEELRTILKHSEYEITPWAEVLAFNAARANMLAQAVAPLLNEGYDVISDRSYISTMTYQGYGNGWEADELERLRQVCKIAIRPAPPAVIVVLDVSYGVSMGRKAVRGEQTDRFESRSHEYLKKVIYGYLAEADIGHHPIVNADKSEAAVDAAILKAVLPAIS